MKKIIVLFSMLFISQYAFTQTYTKTSDYLESMQWIKGKIESHMEGWIDEGTFSDANFIWEGSKCTLAYKFHGYQHAYVFDLKDIALNDICCVDEKNNYFTLDAYLDQKLFFHKSSTKEEAVASVKIFVKNNSNNVEERLAKAFKHVVKNCGGKDDSKEKF